MEEKKTTKPGKVGIEIGWREAGLFTETSGVDCLFPALCFDQPMIVLLWYVCTLYVFAPVLFVSIVVPVALSRDAIPCQPRHIHLTISNLTILHPRSLVLC